MRSTLKVLFYLQRNAPKKDGSVPVMCRSTVDGGVAQFNCKLDVNPDLWDTESGRASGRSDVATQANRFRDKIRVGGNQLHYPLVPRYPTTVSNYGIVPPLAVSYQNPAYLDFITGARRYVRAMEQ